MGKTIQTYSYDSYGNVLSSLGNVDNPYQFSTKEYSPKSGMIYFGARWYDPRVGRFITPDPLTWGPDDRRNSYQHNPLGPILRGLVQKRGSLNPGLLHRYVYCLNNPVNYVDPWGLKPWWPEWIEVFVPGYGIYGGPFRTDPTFQLEPEDSMDRLFMKHDIAWSEGQGKRADIIILRDLYNLPPKPTDWAEPPKNLSKAIFYRRFLAEPYLWWRNIFLDKKSEK